jgi:hypothetical protein
VSRVLTTLVALLLAVAAGGAEQESTLGLRYSTPDDWERVAAGSPLRGAQFRIPHVRGDDEDGEVVLFRFGSAEGSGVGNNVERWYRQFSQPDGRASKDVAVVAKRTVNGLQVTVVDLTGTYTAEMGSMQKSGKPGYRLLGAVVEGQGDPWFWRAVGPAATMAKAKPGFDRLVDSLAVER